MASRDSARLKRRAGRVAAVGLEKVLRLVGPDGYRFLAQQLYEGSYRDTFDVAGITYHVSPCSVGLTPQGQLTGETASELIRERSLSNLRVLDICCGVGIVGLTMLSCLRDEKRIAHMSFGDINIFNIVSVRNTVSRADPAALGNADIEISLSDNLTGMSPRNQFDLIVSNPPHFDIRSVDETKLNPVGLGSVDPGWIFHRDFYASVHDYLSDDGEIWFLENSDGASEATLLPFIEANAGLEYVTSFPDRRDPTFFWMTSRRARRDSAGSQGKNLPVSPL